MANHTADVNAWEQLVLVDVPIVTLTMTIGLMPGDDHAQFQVEAKNSLTGDLLSMWALPHSTIADAENSWEMAFKELHRLLFEHCPPF